MAAPTFQRAGPTRQTVPCATPGSSRNSCGTIGVGVEEPATADIVAAWAGETPFVLSSTGCGLQPSAPTAIHGIRLRRSTRWQAARSSSSGCLCDSPGIDGFYRAVWRGQSAIHAQQSPADAKDTLPSLLGNAGIQTSLTTDDPWVAEHADAEAFAEVRRIELGVSDSADAIADTAMASVFAMAVDQIETWSSAGADSADAAAGRLLWLHVRGFHGPWDAPQALRQELLDEDGLAAPMFVEAPDLAPADDHDALLLYCAAYAAQTIVLDECMSGLMSVLAEWASKTKRLSCSSAAAVMLWASTGKLAATVANCTENCSTFLVYFGGPATWRPPPRSASLAQPADIYYTLGQWFGLAPAGGQQHSVDWLSNDFSTATIQRQFVAAAGDDGERSLRTPAWMLRVKPGTVAMVRTRRLPVVELFAKPDDRWEFNEVADRCPEIANWLLAVLNSLEAAEGSNSNASMSPLDDDLVGRGR